MDDHARFETLKREIAANTTVNQLVDLEGADRAPARRADVRGADLAANRRAFAQAQMTALRRRKDLCATGATAPVASVSTTSAAANQCDP